MPTPSPVPRWTSALLLVLVAVGVALRLKQVASGRWAWLDEANLGNFFFYNDLLGMPFARGFRMVQPLFYSWAAKLGALVVGSYREWVLRMPALVSGFLTLGGTALLSRRYLAPWGAVTTTGLVALSTLLSYYSWEIKPYSTDAAVALVILATGLLPAGTGLLRPLPRAILVAGVAPWCSLPSVFALPGLLHDAYRRDADRRRRLLVGLLVLLGVSAALNLAWALTVREDMGGFLNGFWKSGYPPYNEGAGAVAAWARERAEGLLRYLLDLGPAWPLGAALALAGLESSRRGDGRLARLTCGTLVFAAGASALEVYPLFTHIWHRNNRLCLYLIPMLAFLVGAGVDAVSRTRAAPLAPVLAAALLAAAGTRSLEPIEDLSERAIFVRVTQEARPDDMVGLGPGSWPLWVYHRNTGRFGAVGETLTALEAGAWLGLEERVPEFPPSTRRVWWIQTLPGSSSYSVWQERLEAGFVLAASQPPEKGLTLWVRPESAPGTPPRP